MFRHIPPSPSARLLLPSGKILVGAFIKFIDLDGAESKFAAKAHWERICEVGTKAERIAQDAIDLPANREYERHFLETDTGQLWIWKPFRERWVNLSEIAK